MTSSEIDEVLHKFGMSNYQTRLYKSLLSLKEAKVPEIADKAGVPTNKAYGDLDWLYQNEFISVSSQKPLKYKIIDPEIVLKSKLSDRIDKLESLKDNVIPKAIDSRERTEGKDIFILGGRDLFFEKMKKKLRNCSESVIATIGTSKIDSELIDIEKKIISNGVEMRFLAEHREEYLPRLKKHMDAGVKVRFSEVENVRFTVWDGHTVTFRVHGDEDEDYYSVWIDSPALANIMISYFDSVWKARSKEPDI